MDYLAITIEILKVLAAPTVAIAAIIVSSQQVAINRTKLRLDLYEKRVAIYEEVRTLIRHFTEEGSLTITNLADFRSKTAYAAFICPKAITDFLTTLDAAAVDLIKLQHKRQLVRGGMSQSDPVALDNRIEGVHAHLLAQQDTAKAIFTTVLSLERDQVQVPGGVLRRFWRKAFPWGK